MSSHDLNPNPVPQDQDISISAWGTGSQWSTFAGRLKQADNGPNGELLRLLHADLADHQVGFKSRTKALEYMAAHQILHLSCP